MLAGLDRLKFNNLHSASLAACHLSLSPRGHEFSAPHLPEPALRPAKPDLQQGQPAADPPGLPLCPGPAAHLPHGRVLDPPRGCPPGFRPPRLLLRLPEARDPAVLRLGQRQHHHDQGHHSTAHRVLQLPHRRDEAPRPSRPRSSSPAAAMSSSGTPTSPTKACRSRTPPAPRRSYVTHYAPLDSYPPDHMKPNALANGHYMSCNGGYAFDLPWYHGPTDLPSEGVLPRTPRPAAGDHAVADRRRGRAWQSPAGASLRPGVMTARECFSHPDHRRIVRSSERECPTTRSDAAGPARTPRH
jgi:hypothetical protein